MRLVVTNNWVRAFDLDPLLARTLDLELRYPTEQVKVAGGRVNPETGWDGWVRLLVKSKRNNCWSFPTGLLGRAVRHAKRMGFAYTLEDRRVRPDQGQPLCPAIPLYDYQTEAVESAVKAGRGVVDSPPRSGKTRLMAEVVRRIALPTLWVAPTDRIVKQTVATLVAFFGAPNVTHLVGGSAQVAAAAIPLVVCTINTAAVLQPAFFESRQALVVDEWHHAASASYRDLFKRAEHIFFRFGMTGTHFRSGDDELAMQALLSNVVYKISTDELVKRGRLVPLDVVFLPTRFEKLRGVSASDFIGGFGKHGAFEHVGRNQLVAQTAAYLARSGRKVLVLIRTKAQGRMVTDMIKPLLKARTPGTQFAPVEFVSTDAKRPKIDAILDSYVSLSEIQVLVGTSMIGEGTDLPVADALVYAAAGHAEVSLMQNAFRVCTAVDGKPGRALIIDFSDRHHRKLLAQSMNRLEVYHSERIFQVHYEPHPKALTQWLQQAGHVALPEKAG